MPIIDSGFPELDIIAEKLGQGSISFAMMRASSSYMIC
jgi:hypothetical protein